MAEGAEEEDAPSWTLGTAYNYQLCGQAGLNTFTVFHKIKKTIWPSYVCNITHNIGRKRQRSSCVTLLLGAIVLIGMKYEL